jgi:hypothetical protein
MMYFGDKITRTRRILAILEGEDSSDARGNKKKKKLNGYLINVCGY